MTPHASEILKRFDALDRMLAKAGFPRTSPWWRKEIRRFYRSGCRRWCVRAGRRAGKSSTLCRLAYVEARWGRHKIPPGDTGFVMFVSRDRDEAAQRLRTIDAIASAVGDTLDVRGDERLFRGRRAGFKVFTASIAGVSGPTAIMVIGDEVAKWRDSDTGANPATEVIASAMPTIATQREARAVWSSSPLGTDDAHATMFDLGDTRHQQVSCAATWEANPTITEGDTHELEPDERVWKREYAAIPQAGALGAFDSDAVTAALGRQIEIAREGPPVMIIDPSSGRKDSWTWAICRWVATPQRREILKFEIVDGIEGRFWQQISGDAVVTRLAGVARQWGCSAVHADQREALMLESGFRKLGLRYVVHTWTQPSKIEAVELVRRWFADGKIALPDHDKLRHELLRFEEKITAGGSFSFGARGSGHDDYVALLLTAAMAHSARGIRPASGSPNGSSALAVARMLSLQNQPDQSDPHGLGHYSPSGPDFWGRHDAYNPALALAAASTENFNSQATQSVQALIAHNFVVTAAPAAQQVGPTVTTMERSPS